MSFFNDEKAIPSSMLGMHSPYLNPPDVSLVRVCDFLLSCITALNPSLSLGVSSITLPQLAVHWGAQCRRERVIRYAALCFAALEATGRIDLKWSSWVIFVNKLHECVSLLPKEQMPRLRHMTVDELKFGVILSGVFSPFHNSCTSPTL